MGRKTLFYLLFFSAASAAGASEQAQNVSVDKLRCNSTKDCDEQDTMVVTAVTPVPVNGNTLYSTKDIERLPTKNGNISDLLRSNPAIRLDMTQNTALNQGDLRPEKISVHGASPYQNLFLIDGVNATNSLNPANDRDLSNATNISGTSQGYFLDIALLDKVTFYDSNVPVEFGFFNGGVIDSRLRRFSQEDGVRLGYRTTHSAWLSNHVDPAQRDHFEQGQSGANYFSPHYSKHFYTLSLDKALNERLGFTAGLSRRESTIRRAEYGGGSSGHRNVIDTLLSKISYFHNAQTTHDVTLKYTHADRQYSTLAFPQSDRHMGNDAWGIAWDMDHRTAAGKWALGLGWDRMKDYTRHAHNEWFTERPCTYGDVRGQCTRGGLGHIDQRIDNLSLKGRWDVTPITVGGLSHQPYLGFGYVHSQATTQRYSRAESYIIDSKSGNKRNHTIYHPGKGKLNIDTYSLYLADRMQWWHVSLTPGIRYDYDNYLQNGNLSPRLLLEWDVLGDHATFLSAGYNRYYGANILNMGLQDLRNSWTETRSGKKSVTQYRQLKTPYTDEMTLGVQQRLGYLLLGVNYVNRQGYDQLNKRTHAADKQGVSLVEYRNDGQTRSDSLNLNVELLSPLRLGSVDISPQLVFSYIKSRGNTSLSQGYEDSGVSDGSVVYNGALVSADTIPLQDFNTPWNIALNVDFTENRYGIVWANTLTYQQARKVRLALAKNHPGYISSLSDYRQYQDTALDSSLNWDSRIAWTPTFLPQKNLTLSVDILNVLDTVSTVNTNSAGVATYASGRQFWLDIGIAF